MSKVKVLHLHTLPVISGSGINTFLTMRGLDKKRYDVELACAPGGALEKETVQAGITFRRIHHFVQPVSAYNDLMALWEVFKLIQKEKYDILHTHNSKAGFIGRLAGRLAATPIIIHTIHGFSFHEFEKPPRRWLFLGLERFAARFTDMFITISEPLKEWGLSVGIGDASRYVTIYSGIEIDTFRAKVDIEEKKRRLGIDKNAFVIGVVSKLWEGKGHRCILHAAKEVITKVANVKFLFVGEGYLREELQELTQQLGLVKHVLFTGFRSDIPEVTACFDIAVLASFFEGMGRVLLEAMAAGKPVVATRVGGIIDVVDDGETGILVAPGDLKALARALVTLLHDEGLRSRMGRAGEEKIDSTFSAATMVEKIDQVYKDLVNRRRTL